LNWQNLLRHPSINTRSGEEQARTEYIIQRDEIKSPNKGNNMEKISLNQPSKQNKEIT
jgi:hypothetical protein